MQKKIPVPSFTIDAETGEVRIPYDQFHTFMNEVVDNLNSVSDHMEALQVDSYVKHTEMRIKDAWEVKDELSVENKRGDIE